jgi:aryl-alcohol dehydrogenase-like predicted oxidoreductase
MKRRTFMKTGFLGGALIPLISTGGCKKEKPDAASLPRRTLGRTGEELSVLGFGGILVRDTAPAAAREMVAMAVDRGVNYFDVAPSYGNAEEILGPALKPFRKKSFLACKTGERDREGAERELHASLRRLETDHLDLYQLHALFTREDVETALGPDGAVETFEKARRQGKVRFIGFSAHSEEAALLAMDRYAFDTILFPFNYVCWHQGRFGPRVLETAREKSMGVLALKSLAFSSIPEGVEEPYEKLWYVPIEESALQALALRFTLSLGVTAALPPGEAAFFPAALEAAERYQPLNREEEALLQKRAEGVTPLFPIA